MSNHLECTSRTECMADVHALCCPSVKRRHEAECAYDSQVGCPYGTPGDHCGCITTTAPEPQVWEQKVPGSDLAAQRMHLQVDDEGRVRLHEALVAQLLVDAGWERAS